jgi:soluble P-type ATPase
VLDINIPGAQPLRLSHLILDYNGTLACDGSILPGVAECLKILAEHLDIHIVTADTFGNVRTQVAHLPVQLAVIPPGKQAQAKAAYTEKLGPANSVAIGNGRNDALMLQQSALGIAVMQTDSTGLGLALGSG